MSVNRITSINSSPNAQDDSVGDCIDRCKTIIDEILEA